MFWRKKNKEKAKELMKIMDRDYRSQAGNYVYLFLKDIVEDNGKIGWDKTSRQNWKGCQSFVMRCYFK